ncbi:MAG: VWA domain-containing protein, partial [Clostridiales bacterium]|nr:VWA domain-containing protein [Clostridiales bacterium]
MPGGIGALVVKNVPHGRVHLIPQAYSTITDKSTGYTSKNIPDYGESALYGIPVGEDLHFNVPAGYYTLIENQGGNKTAGSQLIPVSAGEQTTVYVPETWRAASKALSTGDDDRALTGSIDVVGMTDLTQTAELAFTVSDPYDRDVHPTKENTVITEGGKPVEIVDIRREVAPCSVALVIDSSGSMKDDMKPTIEAAQKFVESLPDSSFVKIVDFAGYVNPLPGETKAEALKALSGITAVGSTMLYDATLEGLKQVEGKTRPAVIVFTDGVDSREAPGTGKGSSSTKDAVVQKIEQAGIPVYTIGFGKRLNDEENLKDVDGAPDIACLIEFAAVSGGEYYPAKNPDALGAVFAAIGSKLGNNFVITYNRPTENNISDTPVYSLMIDNSGSMDTSPEVAECGYRMEKTKLLLTEFVGKLPNNAIAQVSAYQGGGDISPIISHYQMPTTDKAKLLKAIGDMRASSGTPIVEALRGAYENLIAVPTSKRVVVFLSDSNLRDSDYGFGHKAYYEMLEKIRDKGIHMLWIGMGVDTPEWQERYAEGAALTDGAYVISESAEDIMKALEALLAKVAREGETRSTPVTVDLSYTTEQGELVTYKAQATANFSPPQKKGAPVEPDYIRF